MLLEINAQRMLHYVKNTPEDIRLLSKSELDREFSYLMSSGNRVFNIDTVFHTSHKDALIDSNLSSPEIYTKCGVHVFNYRSIVNSFFTKECMIIKCYISMNMLSIALAKKIVGEYLAKLDNNTMALVSEIMSKIKVPLSQYH